MSKRIIQRAKALTVEEVLVRGRQKLHSLAERHGLSSLAKLPSDEQMFRMLEPSQRTSRVNSVEEFVARLKLRRDANFLGGFVDRERTIEDLKSKWSSVCEELISRASEITRDRFRFFGFEDLSFRSPIDWHLNPLTGQRASLVHWSKLNQLDPPGYGDRKLVWELNRHQYFSTLGQAFLLTGDEVYAETFVRHLTGWMDQNPPKMGINWSSSLEISFRSISWLWAFHFFKGSKALTPQVFMRALKFLYLSARHLETFLSTYYSPNTHLTGEALGLLYLSKMLPELKDAKRWEIEGQKILVEQIRKHVQPDGVYFEQTSYYHRYTTDFYIHFVVLSRFAGDDVSLLIEEKLNLLLTHLMYLTRPDGTTPFVGDDDGGQLLKVDQRPANDFRSTLSTGATLYRRSDLKFVSEEPAIETLLLLGPSGVEAYDSVESQQPEKMSIAFENGGYYVMRDAWNKSANYLLVDCGPHGTLNCGHAHADALAIETVVGGRSVLVDPGTYTYSGDKELRDWFRGSTAHNTLTVGKRSSSTPGGPFGWSTVAQCLNTGWISSNRFDYFKGQHDGYFHSSPPVIHERTILFLKENYWIIRDKLIGGVNLESDIWFHFDAGIRPALASDREGGTSIHDSGFELRSFLEKVSGRKEDGWVSNCYLSKEVAEVCVLTGILGGERNAFTFILPQNDKWRVSESKASGGQAFEIVNDSWRDIVMIRREERVELGELSSDFDWTWWRYPTNDTRIESAIFIEGKTSRVDERDMLTSEDKLAFVEITTSNGSFVVAPDSVADKLSLDLLERRG